jgi:predicted HTH domain antitoxin
MDVTISLPENLFLGDSAERVAAKIKRYAAIGLYQAGEFSVGAAAELAGLNRYAFLELCKQTDVILRTQTPEEIQSDFDDFKT